MRSKCEHLPKPNLELCKERNPLDKPAFILSPQSTARERIVVLTKSGSGLTTQKLTHLVMKDTKLLKSPNSWGKNFISFAQYGKKIAQDGSSSFCDHIFYP
jgi:hypothetical protein